MADNENNFALPKKNLLWIIVGFGVLVLGYILLIGGGSQDPSVFSPQIFSFRRMVLAPVVMIIGCAVIVYSIMHRGKSNKEN